MEGSKINPIENVEGPKRFLFIDDDSSVLTTIRRYIGKNPAIIYVECHSVADAISAIEANNPDEIFVDNNLTRGGNEGLKIVDIVKSRWPNIKIYSTTLDYDMAPLYKEKGVEHIGKDKLHLIEEMLKAKLDPKE